MHEYPSPAPGRWERTAFLLALIIQQNAFLSIPMLLGGVGMGEMRGVENTYNSFALGFTVAFIGWEILNHGRELQQIARQNLPIVFFAVLALGSTAWSIHSEITFRRAVGQVLTLALAALLPLRFGVNGFMKALSASFAVSAIGSLLYTVVLPQYGIMHVDDREGDWQGVFATKELLGSVMAVSILTELYVLFSSRDKRWWRAGLLLPLYLTLLVLSRSTTALLVAGIYLFGAATYLLWKRYQWRGVASMALNTAVVALVFVASVPESKAAFNALGKDSTLTGRVYLWQEVDKLIAQKPALGWGYRAMWQPNDRITEAVDSVAGFEAASAHNTYREVTLDMGFIGLLALVGVVLTTLRRGVQCCRNGFPLLGWFTLMFVAGCAISGMTTESMGMNQVVDWLVFNALLMGCGISLQKRPALAI
jgi:exopolysaccharide production protein ExoQ